MSDLSIVDLHLHFGAVRVLEGVSAAIAHGEIVALLGRSGCGKSTLLRAIAGLETPSAGRIALGERALFDAKDAVNLAPEKRELGLVFQSYALWPHMRVRDNVGYGLKVRGKPADEIARGVDEALAGVGLAGLADRYPGQLSGGQQQRVALARALVYRPPLLLLDEPLSNLDAKLREEARIWIRDLIKSAGLTAVFVTHDQAEAMAVADRIMLLESGRVVQSGAPEELYTNPASRFVADFMGVNNSVAGVLRGGALDLQGGARIAGENRGAQGDGAEATAIFRVESVRLDARAGDSLLPATLKSSNYLGDRYEHVFDSAGALVRAWGPTRLSPGRYDLAVAPDAVWIF